MTKEELIELLETYLRRIRFANDCLISAKSIWSAVLNHNAVINQSSGFFTICLLSLERSMCMELAKLYSGSGEERTIEKLNNIIKANQHLFPSEIDCTPTYVGDSEIEIKRVVHKVNVSDMIETFTKGKVFHEETIKALKARRNKYIAHNDREYFLDEEKLKKDFPVKLKDVEDLITYTGDYCNKILSSLNRTVIAYHSQNADDLSSLLSKVVLNTND
ncbi:MAG: hypothetical protein IKV41_05850 [Oscillospiraceae bacterium]|nr:hypothetical protein [Oscillospiraceae bacterium]